MRAWEATTKEIPGMSRAAVEGARTEAVPTDGADLQEEGFLVAVARLDSKERSMGLVW